MAYRTPLETRIAKKTTKAIVDYNLIEDGDRIMVGLSGGKDSWALIQILDVLRQARADAFSHRRGQRGLGYEGYQHQAIADACAARGWEFHHEHTTIGAVIDDKLDADATPARCARGCAAACSIAGRPRSARPRSRSGHHLDDFVETLLLNLFFAGALKAMPARLVSDNRRTSSFGRSSTSPRPRRAPTRATASCRSSAAAVRPAAISACSGSASSA